jgi:hypothetical protein
MSPIEDDDRDVEMQARVAALEPLRPARDLWPGIAARIAARGEGAPAITRSRAQRSWRWMSAHRMAAGVVLFFVATTYVATRWSLGPGVPMTLASGRSEGEGEAPPNGTASASLAQPTVQHIARAYRPELAAIMVRTQESAATQVAWANGQDTQGRQTIDTLLGFATTGGVVDLGLIAGEITVTGWERPEAKIHAASEGPPIQATIGRDRIALDVHPHHDDRDVAFDLTVPFGTRVIMHSVSGDVRVHDVRGELDGRTVSGDADVAGATATTLESVSGDLRAHGIAGNVRVLSVSGDVDLEDVRGDVDIGTVSGDIMVPRARSRAVHVESVSGDVAYGGPIDPTGRYEFHSHSGDVTLHLPASASAALSLDTFSGSVDSDFPVPLTDARQVGLGHHIDGMLGQGGPRVTIETFSGDIALKRSGD